MVNDPDYEGRDYKHNPKSTSEIVLFYYAIQSSNVIFNDR